MLDHNRYRVAHRVALALLGAAGVVWGFIVLSAAAYLVEVLP